MHISKIDDKYRTDKVIYKNYKVIEPIWDSFLRDLYRSIISRSSCGIKTKKLDLSLESNLHEYINILISEFYKILKINDFIIDYSLITDAWSTYYFKQTNGIILKDCNLVNPLITFNENVFKNGRHKPTPYIYIPQLM